MAEILITIGIIGVVAAMTLPSLVQQHQKKAITVALEKMYTTLMQAANTYYAIHNVMITEFDTSLTPKEFMETYFNPYLNISMVCKDDNDCWDGNRSPKALDQKTDIKIDYGVILADGRILGVNSFQGGVVFIFDADGKGGYNRAGHDIFNFYLVNTSTLGTHSNCEYMLAKLKSGIYPGSFGSCYKPHSWESRADLLGTSVHRSCNKNTFLSYESTYAGDACAALIMQDGWEMKKDYPAW